MVKDILVKLETGARDPAGDYALSIGQSLGGHVIGVAFAYELRPAPYMLAQLPPGILESVEAEREQEVRAALERFRRAANVVSLEDRFCRPTETGAPELFAKMARRADLSVAMQSDRGVTDNDALIEAALFDSGRPICVVPYIQRDGLNLDRVMCCWDGSRTAARAINDAMPLLARAAAVDLLVVLNEKTQGNGREVRGVEMARHLARHDVKVSIATTPAADIDAGNAILSFAADNAATMIVMGGYGHSRLREFVLGGVTRAMLSSMTVPVFMSH